MLIRGVDLWPQLNPLHISSIFSRILELWYYLFAYFSLNSYKKDVPLEALSITTSEKIRHSFHHFHIVAF